MEDFKTLSTKKSIFTEIINDYGGPASAIILIIAILNIFLFTRSLTEMVYRLPSSIIIILILFVVLRYELYEDFNTDKLPIITVLFVIVAFVINYLIYFYRIEVPICLEEAIFLGFINIVLVLIAFIVILFALLFILNCYISLSAFFLEYKITSMLPTTRQELISCGVHNRADCLLYYRLMERNFRKNRKNPIILLSNLRSKDYYNLAELYYQFELSYFAYKEIKTYLSTKYKDNIIDDFLAKFAPEYNFGNEGSTKRMLLKSLLEKPYKENEIFSDISQIIEKYNSI